MYVLMYVYVCMCLSICLSMYLSVSLNAKHEILQEFESYLPSIGQACDPIHPSLGLTLISLPVYCYKAGNKYYF